MAGGNGEGLFFVEQLKTKKAKCSSEVIFAAYFVILKVP